MQKKLSRSVSKVICTILLGIFCALFALLLKIASERAEHFIFTNITGYFIWLLLITPLIGLALIYFVTTGIFKMPISGIREIINSLQTPFQELKPVKTILHFITGGVTIIFGGSTGIEVSTVVASSAAGSWIGGRKMFTDEFRRQLIVVGAAAGIAGLFRSPLGGLFFAIEVLMVTFSWELILLCAIASFVAFGVRNLLYPGILFHPNLHGWNINALPFYVLFALVTSLLSVYLTKGVIKAKTVFNSRFGGFRKIWAGGILLGMIVIILTPLYGEGYSFIESLLLKRFSVTDFSSISGVLFLAILLFLKPVATSLTLASGGDGGVFAPSLFLGAVAGCLFAQTVNYFGGSVIEVNFIVVGMAAILSASLHAPLSASFIAMSITGSYELFIPILLTSILSSFLAKKIFSFTVYSYSS